MSVSYWAAFILAGGLALVLTPLARRLSQRWGMMAMPGGRRQHARATPRFGGLVLTGAYLAAAGLVWLWLPPAGDDAIRLRGVLLGTLIIFIGGALDDRWDLSPRAQFAVQGLAAGVAMLHLVFIGVFTNPFEGQPVPFEATWPLLAYAATLLWMLGIMNAVNWLDGLDGLAAGVGTIAMLMFAWHSYRLGQTTVAAFPLALAGALLGFLPANLAPARLFLGSAGAYVLGYNLATLSILAPAKIATTLLVLALPLLDGVWRIVDRLLRGQSPFDGDRRHLHYLLLDRGWSVWQIVVVYCLVALVFGLVAIFAPTGLSKLVVLLILGSIVLGCLISLSRTTRLSGAADQER